MIADSDIAEIYEALGDPRGALVRDRIAWERSVQPDQEELDALDKLWSIEVFADAAAGNVLTGKHDKECFKKHARCLANIIRDIL